MKKLIVNCLLTVSALTLTEHQAHAWVNSKFNVGLNWYNQSGNNNILWGLWRNGQIPGPEAFGPGGGQGGGGGGGGGGSYFPGLWGMQTPPNSGMGTQTGLLQAPYQQSYYGPQGYWQGMPQAYPQTLPPGLATDTIPLQDQSAAQQQSLYYPIQNWNGGNPYQGAGYQRNASNYYQPNYYYYPAYSYDSTFQWYGAR